MQLPHRERKAPGVGDDALISFMEFSLHLVLQALVLCSCIQGSGSFYQIKHNDHETAVLGENVILFCNMTTPEDILQITWQKIQDSLPQNIGTYSRKHGVKILPPYLDRLHCDVIEPKASFLTIREVTFGDEACYKCLFNMFPYGSHGAQICLHILTVSELNIELQSDPNYEGVLWATCSAMGKPAPQISLFPSQILMNPPEEHRALNPDGTVTVTKVSNISLEAAASLGVHHLIVHMDHPLGTKDKVVPLAAKEKSLAGYSHVCEYVMVSLVMTLIIGIGPTVCIFQRKNKKLYRNSSSQTSFPISGSKDLLCGVSHGGMIPQFGTKTLKVTE